MSWSTATRWSRTRSQTRYAAYLSDVHAVRAIFPTAQVSVVLPPQMQHVPNDDVVQALVDSGGTVIDGRTPLGGNVYAQTMPCLPDEGPAHGCDAGGMIAVRALDGVHFCNGPGACATT